MTIVDPAAVATDLNSRAPYHAPRACIAVSAGAFLVDGLAIVARAMTTSDQPMALIAVDNLDLNPSGMGIYPLAAKPS